MAEHKRICICSLFALWVSASKSEGFSNRWRFQVPKSQKLLSILPQANRRGIMLGMPAGVCCDFILYIHLHPFCWWRWCKLAAVGRVMSCLCLFLHLISFDIIICIFFICLLVFAPVSVGMPDAGWGWLHLVFYGFLWSLWYLVWVYHWCPMNRFWDKGKYISRQVSTELLVVACNLGFPKCPTDGQVGSHDVLFLICLRTPLTFTFDPTSF